jgi:hypothetical protein
MNHTDILNRKVTDVKPAPPLPAGTYLAVITGLPIEGKVGDKETPIYDFPISIIAAQPDVDQDALATWMKESGKELRGTVAPRARFFLTEAAAFRIKELLTACGLDVNDDSKTLMQLINETTNKQLLIGITHAIFTPKGKTDPEVIANTNSYAKVD